MMRKLILISVFGVVLGLAACSESLQTLTPDQENEIPTKDVTQSPTQEVTATSFVVEITAIQVEDLTETPTVTPTVTETQTAFQAGASKPGLSLSLSYTAIEQANQPANVISGLKEEIYFSGGYGGGSNSCNGPQNVDLPIIGWSESFFSEDIQLCLIGFSETEVDVTIYTPDGAIAGTKKVQLESDPRYDGIEIEERDGRNILWLHFADFDWTNDSKYEVVKDVSTAFVDIGIPKAAVEAGTWKITIEDIDSTVEGFFLIEEKSAVVTTMRELFFNPFGYEGCQEYDADDTVYIVGSGFTPFDNIELGIYYDANKGIELANGDHGWVQELLFGANVVVSEEGDFVLPYVVKEEDPGGWVHVILNPDEVGDDTTGADYPCFSISNPIINPTPNPTEDINLNKPCKDAPPTRLAIGDHAIVGLDPPYPNTVREKPGLKEKRLGSIQPGEEVEVLKGPQCSDALVWWKVVSMKTGLDGWTAEGDEENYWLVPLEE